MDYRGAQGVPVKTETKVHMVDLASVIQLMFCNPSLKWDEPSPEKGLRCFSNTPFAQVSSSCSFDRPAICMHIIDLFLGP